MTSAPEPEGERRQNPFSRRSFLGFSLGAGFLAALPGRAQTEAKSTAPTLRADFPQRSFSGLSSGPTDPSSIASVYETIKREGTPEELYKFLYALPKGGDIHHHMGGSMLPDMWWKIATDPARNGGQTFYTRFRLTNAPVPPELAAWMGPHMIQWMTIHQALYAQLEPQIKADFMPLEALSEADRAAWKSSIVLDSIDEGRNEFFEYHWPRLGALLFDITVNAELLVENMQRYGAEGIRYLEIMMNPWGKRAPDGRILTAEETYAYFEKRLAQPDALKTGVMVRFQSVVIRFTDGAVDDVRTHFEWLDKHRGLWRGINMAGREDDNRGYPARFTEVFDEMLRLYPGIGVSIHAGEAEKPDTYIKDTLRLGANRIGHACNLIRDADTMQLMRCGKFLVEINLVSNHLLKYVPDPKKHPFPVYLRQGIPCCLNTDDRGMWSSNMTDEYYLAVSHFNLSWQELVKLGHNSLEFAYLTDEERTDRLNSYAQALVSFEKTFTLKTWKRQLEAVKAETYGYAKRYFNLTF